MTTSAVYTFATAAEDQTVGSVAWGSYANVLTDDTNQDTVTPGTGNQSYYLLCTNPNPTEIGDSDTIDAIRVRFRRDASTSNRVSDASMRIFVAGSVSGDEKAAAGNWGSITTTITYGDLASDAWGLTLTGSDVKASNFGVGFSLNGAASAEGRAEFIDITFEYTAVAGGAAGFMTPNRGYWGA